MNQALLDLNTRPATATERQGFELGWDHAHHGLVPPPELLLQGTPLRQGWQAGRALFGARTLAAGLGVRRWLALRTDAWRLGIDFEGLQLTAHYIAQIDASHCPVTLRALGGAAGSPDAPVIERLQPDAAYAAGHLVTMSRAAAVARAGCSAQAALAQADALTNADGTQSEELINGLDAAAWRRLGVLIAYATPLPHAEAASLPMCVLPPNRVRVLNPAQGLQALVTLQLSTPGWSRRLRQLGELAEEISGEPAMRQELQLFIGALAPRVLELPLAAEVSALAQRRALAAVWNDARVMRRWSHLLLSLGEAATEALLTRAIAVGGAAVAGVHTVLHERAIATEGWHPLQPATHKSSTRMVPGGLPRAGRLRTTRERSEQLSLR
jgi:hypothetical protein